MPTYPLLSTVRANDLEKDLKAEKKALDELVKNKADKKVVQAARTKYEKNSSVLSKVITDDMTTAKTGFATMSKFVDDRLNEAMKITAQARTDLKSLTPGPKADAALRKYAGLGDAVKQLSATASDEIDAYAKSWNAYRTANYELDKPLLAKFGTIRTGIIDDTIKIRTRHRKIEALGVEAESLQNALFEKLQGYATDSDNKLILAKRLLASINASVKDLKSKNDPATLEGSARRFKEWVELDYPTFSAQIDTRGKAYTAAKATGQACKTTLSTLQRSAATGRATITAQDVKENAELAEVVDRIDRSMAAFEKEVKDGLRKLMEVAQLVNLAQVRIKQKA